MNYDDDYDLQIKRSMKPGNEKIARKRESERIREEKRVEREIRRKKRNKVTKGAYIFSTITIILFFLMLGAGAYFIFFTDLTISFGETEAAEDSVDEEVAENEEEEQDISKKFTDIFTKQDDKPKKKKGVTNYVEIPKTEVNSDMYSDPGKYALTTEYDYVTADEDYYRDALFIGDSRIENFRIHDYFPGATYYCKVGIGISTIMSERIAKLPNGNETTIPEALKSTQFKKIYIMVGVNNMGAHTTAEFFDVYLDMVTTIQNLQPDAKIFILSIMHVSAKYNDHDRGLTNNTNINDRNVAISTLADGENIFYFNLNQLIVEDDGDLMKGYSNDGLHLKTEYYYLWVDYINEHALPADDFK